jgi:hypothetical protein
LRQNAGSQVWSAKAEAPFFAVRGPQNGRLTRHKLTPCPEIDCVRHLLPPGLVAAAELRAVEVGTGADRALTAQNAIPDEQYVKALAHSTGARFDTLARVDRRVCPASDLELIEATKTGILWLRSEQHRVLVIAPQGRAAQKLVQFLRVEPAVSANICLTTGEHLVRFAERHARPALARKAVFELSSAHPEFSASTDHARSTATPVIGGLAVLAAFGWAPDLMTTIVDVALALVFLGWTLLRAMGIVVTACARQLPSRRSGLISDTELPVYSIIVALYRETAAVAGLIDSFRSLDYPFEKLDILLVLEPDDHDTRDALARLHLGPPFTILVAPTAGPRTKPKALNFALPFARGRYVAVFDAEDRPDSDQLRKALQAFQAGNDRLVCVQARLAIDNADETLLTRGIMAQTPQAHLARRPHLIPDRRRLSGEKDSMCSRCSACSRRAA